MGFSCGIVGLPNVGKSTLFNALTSGSADVANYPFTTVDNNVGVVSVPDPRLHLVAEVVGSDRAIPTAISFVDIAGLVRGASRGEGLGNRFLGHIREVDAIVQVLRCFEDERVSHVDSTVDPKRDVDTVFLEMVLADLETLERRAEKVRRSLKAGVPGAQKEGALLEQVKSVLETGQPACIREFISSNRDCLEHLFLLTAKPVIYVGNVGEDEAANPETNPHFAALLDRATQDNVPALAISAKIESEILELDLADRDDFLRDLGLQEPGVSRLIGTCYQHLDLITFFTANAKEARAWTIRRGTPAVKAAGQVHSDMEKGFISAEVLSHSKLGTIESYGSAREKGIVRLEGKTYIVNDGDLMLFRFSS